MKTIHTSVNRYFKVTTATIVLLFISHLSMGQLSFKNPSRISGNNLAVGSTYRFSSVYTGIDAILSIDSAVNGASVSNLDDDNVGYINAFQPYIQIGGNGNSYIVFTIRFVKENTNITEFLGSLTTSSLDLDGNANLKEMCEFDLGGGTATFMHNNPQIKVQQSGSWFKAINLAGIEYTGIDTSASSVMYKVTRNNISQFSVRLGAVVRNNASAQRQFSVYMKDFAIANATSLPLTLLHFDAVLKTDKVELNWSTTDHKNFSHFILQRSADGRNFKDVMTLMTDEVSATPVQSYNYKDNVSDVNEGIIYYRLQMVDADTRFQYSPVRLVRLNTNNNIKVQTFPNPVANELRVMVPAQWQDKTTTYEVYTSTGALVSRTQVARAAQIQQLNVQSLGSGNYIVRVSNGQESSSSKFIKF